MKYNPVANSDNMRLENNAMIISITINNDFLTDMILLGEYYKFIS